MAHGFPDYGIAAPSDYAFPIVSWDDYFIRSGLVKTLDGKGDIIFHDSFENGMAKWYQTIGDGVNATVELSPDHAFGGDWSLKHTVASGHSIAESAATIPVDEPDRFGAEFRFTLYADYYHPQCRLLYYDLTKYYSFGVRYNSITRKLQYHATGDAWTNFADVTWELNPLYYFHPVKLVIDAKTLKYVKFIARGITYDLSGKDPDVETQTSRRAIQPRFMWRYTSGTYYPSYLDDVIVTTNEP